MAAKRKLRADSGKDEARRLVLMGLLGEHYPRDQMTRKSPARRFYQVGKDVRDRAIYSDRILPSKQNTRDLLERHAPDVAAFLFGGK